MPWKQIRNDVGYLCLGYAACFFLEGIKIPPGACITIFVLSILLGIALTKIDHLQTTNRATDRSTRS